MRRHYTKTSHGIYKGVALALVMGTCYLTAQPDAPRRVSSPRYAHVDLGARAMTLQPWMEPGVVQWTQLLLDSYRRWVGKDLIERHDQRQSEARALFESPLVVVSHGTEADPILNYGNQTALTLWEMTWEALVKTPSRLTAETVNRAERERMLEQARSRGYIDTYRGIRISATGRRFLVENALIWNVLDVGHQPLGQAATFSRWTWLP